MEKSFLSVHGHSIPIHRCNTIVVGSGAAALSAADHIHKMGQTDIALVTEKVGAGVSHNSGSDKQTYYKLSVFGGEEDSPQEMARSLYEGGSMHGDLALIESVLSPRCFFRLVEIGVPFPHDRMGGYVGYKTDHDPRQRATSAGPWTSREMVRSLLREIRRRGLKVFDGHEVIALIADEHRVYGAAALDKSRLEEPSFGLTLFLAENVVFGVGGPGGLYRNSVYPDDHAGAIGLALEIGAKAANLSESQFGLASIKPRWNISGTYQQVIPRYFSTSDAGGDERDFLNEYFPDMGRLATDIFLKGYQWPFDIRKIRNYGSSLIDILVSFETLIKGRRVFMDFRDNPRGGAGLEPFTFEALGSEALTYLDKSGACFGNPFDRLKKMNPPAVELYREKGIDLEKEPLEISVCAQHNNGGLSVDIWWESNIRHLFPVGEVAGTHGVYRPGGSALNSGQAGSLRSAQRIVSAYKKSPDDLSTSNRLAAAKAEELLKMMGQLTGVSRTRSDLPDFRARFQERMTRYGGHIREIEGVKAAAAEGSRQLSEWEAIRIAGREELPGAMRARHLVTAHAAYLEAIRFYLEAGGGSRGSSLILDDKGLPVLEDKLGEWKFKPESEDFRELVQETTWDPQQNRFRHSFVGRRPIPKEDSWFENVWGEFVEGRIFE